MKIVLVTLLLVGLVSTHANDKPDVTGAEAVQGKLVALNLVNKHIAVQNEDGMTTDLFASDSTQVFRGEKHIRLQDLRIGEQVMVQFRRENENFRAQSIVAAPK